MTIHDVEIGPVHNAAVEARLADGWEIVDQHPTNPDYTIMAKPVED